eukprot:CAMPEP_0172380076 /NCGR_PEP_ID=MMETSP1060-20121228/70248_1 /TAXON_ID=37318 /ORGANISM="Pseudo-nitzschia pungens, Strain cf. cingulata" /LENGTH=482 /DNA_ID=CAMNT_0013107825 /DNA_START=80 /DNA_END=1529 /DNA_ORIENTATION=-
MTIECPVTSFRSRTGAAGLSFDNHGQGHRGSIPCRHIVLCFLIRIHAVSTLVFLGSIAIFIIPVKVVAERPDTNSYILSNRRHSNNPISKTIRGDPFDADWDDVDENARDDHRKKPDVSSRRGSSIFGFGREFSLFESVPCVGSRNNRNNNNNNNNKSEFSLFESVPCVGSRNNRNNNNNNNNNNGDDLFGSGYSYDDSDVDGYDFGSDDQEDPNEDEDDFFRRMERYRERRKSISSISSGGYNNVNNEGYTFSRSGRPPFIPMSQQQRRRKQQQQQQQQPQPQKPAIIQNAQNWWKVNVDPKLQSLPKIVCRIEPCSTLKLRKTFRPLKTIIRLGADYNTQQGIWQFKSSWEDAIIGGKITLSGSKELQLTKSWQMSVGGVEDLVTRLRLRATINLQTFQAYAKVGFRTERLTPIDVVEGFTILKRLPLDGSGGNLKLEVKANVALPEPEIEYSTESQARSLTGMGNIEVSIDEMNLLLDY